LHCSYALFQQGTKLFNFVNKRNCILPKTKLQILLRQIWIVGANKIWIELTHTPLSFSHNALQIDPKGHFD
jgi:hypothetical protein